MTLLFYLPLKSSNRFSRPRMAFPDFSKVKVVWIWPSIDTVRPLASVRRQGGGSVWCTITLYQNIEKLMFPGKVSPFWLFCTILLELKYFGCSYQIFILPLKKNVLSSKSKNFFKFLFRYFFENSNISKFATPWYYCSYADHLIRIFKIFQCQKTHDNTTTLG